MQAVQSTQLQTNKVVVITGASRGIGAELAVKLAGQGYQVVINYASAAQQAEAVLAQIKAAGGVAAAFQADVSQAAGIKALFDFAEQTYGRVDVLINNAGVFSVNPIQELDDAAIDRLIDINIKGTLYGMREAAKRLQQGGKIINLSSSVIGMNLEGYGVYTATKAAVESLTRIMAKELRSRDITVNAVAPGPTATELFFQGKSDELVQRLAKASPLERLGTPEDIVKVLAFMVGEDSNWINAQVIRANGGIV